MCGLCTRSHTCELNMLCLWIMKLWIMNVDTKTKVLLKFDSLERVCVDMRSKKQVNLPHYRCMVYVRTCSHTCELNMLCLDYETLDYECRH